MEFGDLLCQLLFSPIFKKLLKLLFLEGDCVLEFQLLKTTPPVDSSLFLFQFYGRCGQGIFGMRTFADLFSRGFNVSLWGRRLESAHKYSIGENLGLWNDPKVSHPLFLKVSFFSHFSMRRGGFVEENCKFFDTFPLSKKPPKSELDLSHHKNRVDQGATLFASTNRTNGPIRIAVERGRKKHSKEKPFCFCLLDSLVLQTDGFLGSEGLH